MKYLVIYSSRTGNTEKIAMEIFEALPGNSKDIQRVEEQSGEADTYFVGFWNDKGICGGEIMEFLEGLHGKQVAIFGTCGMGEDPEYCRQVSKRVEALIPEDNRYLGSFLCSGKMVPQVLERYRMMQRQKEFSAHPADDPVLRGGYASPGQQGFGQCQDVCGGDHRGNGSFLI